MNILITGASGLLGKALSNQFSNSKDHLFLLTRNTSLELENIGDVIQKDVSEPGFARSLPLKIDTIYHLVQSRKYKSFPMSADEIFRTNVAATQELLDFSIRTGVSKFIYASSGGIYESNKFKFKEDSPLQKPSNIDYYLGTKMASELLIQSYRGLFEHVILRYFFLYGKYQNREMLLPRIYDNVLHGRPIVLNGERGLQFNPIHVNDAARLTKNALQVSGSSTINISGPKVHNLKEVAEIFGRHCSRVPIIEINEGQNLSMVSDLRAMNELLGESKILLQDSLEDIRPPR